MNPTDAPQRHSILVVDDTPENLALMSGLLQDLYQVRVAPSGARALKIAQSERPPDLILLDIMMPEMDGYAVCVALKADERTCHIPVIFLTAMSEETDEEMGLGLGAVDYVTKPVSPPILLARVKSQLSVKAAADFLRDKSAYLEQEVQRRTREVREVQDATVLMLSSLAETRDNETGNHILRTQRYVRVLAEALRMHPRFAAVLDNDETQELLYKSAPLHDIGKVGIPDRILLKPARLTPEEFEVMKTHTTLGRDAIEHAEARLGHTVPFLALAKEIAYSHQEKWDGSGYPQGLAGDAIPVSARLMALADVYDALISRRVYKAPMPHEQAVSVIEEGRGTHFDPDVADTFLALHEEFQAIARELADGDQELQAQLLRVETMHGAL